MSKKIVGVTVGTPLGIHTIKDKLKAITSVNGITADKDGNLKLDWLPVEYIEDLIAPEKEVEGFVGRGFEGAAVEKLAVGDSIAIYYDGVRYVSPVFAYEDSMCAGNIGLINGYPGMPFFIMIYSTGRINLSFADKEKHIVSIYKLIPNEKIPANLLPDGVPYSGGGSLEILPETDFESEHLLTEPLGLIEGEMYTVVYYGEAYEDGKTFDVPCIKLEVEGLSIMALGNVYIMAEGMEGIEPTDEPFVVLEYPMNIQGAYGAIVDVSGSESAEISITKRNLRKLPIECLPDGITPHIGENGNWWIGEDDTGVSASASGGGGEAEWGKVVDLKTTEDLTSFSVTEDMDGNPLSFEEALVFVAVSRPADATTNGTYVFSLQSQWSSSFNQYGLYQLDMLNDFYVFQIHIKKHTHDLYEIRKIARKRIAANAASFTGVLSEKINNRTGVGITDGSFNSTGAVHMNIQNDKGVFNSAGKFCGITIGVDLASSMKLGAGAVLEVWAR